jgi:hypothetical protein
MEAKNPAVRKLLSRVFVEFGKPEGGIGEE